jgi:Na+-translocating ferredoxin:NAD+ oxidoreductase RnfA subunit
MSEEVKDKVEKGVNKAVTGTVSKVVSIVVALAVSAVMYMISNIVMYSNYDIIVQTLAFILLIAVYVCGIVFCRKRYLPISVGLLIAAVISCLQGFIKV